MVVTVKSRTCANLLAGLAAAAVALAPAACSSSAGQGGTAPTAKVALTFKVNHGPGTPVVRHWTLSCEPAGGTRPNAATACSALLKLKNPFAPRSKAIACPMILRSDRKIIVTGTWFGTKVHRLVMDGGCDLALFSKLGKIFR